MFKKSLAMAAVAVLVTVGPAAAQKVEVSGLFGWTLSDGVEGDAVLAGDGNLYDTVDLKDSASWGLAVGFNATDNVEVGFLFGQQMSELEISGTATRNVGDVNINTYHPYVAYNAGAPDARVRPYFLIGFGATNYSNVEFTRANGQRERDRQRDAVLDDLGPGREGVRRLERRLPRRPAVDADLHQVGLRGLVVRSRTGAATPWPMPSMLTSCSSTAA